MSLKVLVYREKKLVSTKKCAFFSRNRHDFGDSPRPPIFKRRNRTGAHESPVRSLSGRIGPLWLRCLAAWPALQDLLESAVDGLVEPLPGPSASPRGPGLLDDPEGRGSTAPGERFQMVRGRSILFDGAWPPTRGALTRRARSRSATQALDLVYDFPSFATSGIASLHRSQQCYSYTDRAYAGESKTEDWISDTPRPSPPVSTGFPTPTALYTTAQGLQRPLVAAQPPPRVPTPTALHTRA